MSIELINTETGARAVITTLFIAEGQTEPKFAYVRDFGQVLKCRVARRMQFVKSLKSLPAVMFGKRKGPFMKLEPVAPWKIIGTVAWTEKELFPATGLEV